MQWVSDEDAATGSRLGRSAVYFFCGHAFDEQTCERAPDGTFVCAHCQLDPAKARVRRAAEAEQVQHTGHFLCVGSDAFPCGAVWLTDITEPSALRHCSVVHAFVGSSGSDAEH